jgi:hypothetical protein
MNYYNSAELQQWFVTATPAALGPMLKTLTSQPNQFKVVDTFASGTSNETKYNQQQAFVLQQRAITRVLGWINETASAPQAAALAKFQFEESCKRMNKFGTRPVKDGQAYCEGRYLLDSFMEVAVLHLEDRNGVAARQRYKEVVRSLGSNMEGQCKIYQTYSPFASTPLIIYKPTIEAL